MADEQPAEDAAADDAAADDAAMADEQPAEDAAADDAAADDAAMADEQPAEDAAADDAAAEPAGVDLASVCPNPLVIQTGWFPQAERAWFWGLIADAKSIRRRGPSEDPRKQTPT